MRVCTKCGIEKDESFYYVKDKTGRLHSQCKACYKEHRKTFYKAHYEKYRLEYRDRARRQRAEHRRIFREFMLDFMADKACVICGESDMRVLEFDHLDPREKRFSISQAVVKGFNVNEVRIEIQKCRILCANYHKRYTAQQMGWYKAI